MLVLCGNTGENAVFGELAGGAAECAETPAGRERGNSRFSKNAGKKDRKALASASGNPYRRVHPNPGKRATGRRAMLILCGNTGENAVFGESAGGAAGAMEAVETAPMRPRILPVPVFTYELADEEMEEKIGGTSPCQ
jgi:hypothetical protein